MSSRPSRLIPALLPASLKGLARKLIRQRQLGRLRTRCTAWPARRTGDSTVIFAPHPDDCALGCGGLIKHRTDLGERVFVAYLTDGAGSHPGHPAMTPGELAQIRKNEALSGTSILGVPSAQVAFFDAPDGRLPHLDTAQRDRLVGLMSSLIATAGPCEIFITTAADGSTEHTAANALVRLAAAGFPQVRIIEYPVWSIWNPLLLDTPLKTARTLLRFALSGGEQAAKRSAIDCHRSQTRPVPPWTQSVLPTGFAECFHGADEFYFEY
jgi:N-acetylglucosamine malate deacetylase 1